MWAVPGPCLVCAIATPGLGPGGWRCWCLFASLAGVLGDANDEGAVGVILCRGHGGDGRGVVGDVPWHVVGGVGGGVDSALGMASLVLPVVRVSQVMLGGWRVSWWYDGVDVYGVGAGRGLRLGGRGFRVWGLATPAGGPNVRWWLAGDRLACGSGGAGCSWCWGSSFGCLWVCSCRLWPFGTVTTPR